MPQDDVIDLVKTAQDKPVRWLDGLFFSIDGKPVTREQRRYDYAVLQKLRFGVRSERELAKLLNVAVKDRGFQQSLERIAVKGCVIRVLSEWHFEGYWAELEDPKITLTAKGDSLAHDRLPED